MMNLGEMCVVSLIYNYVAACRLCSVRCLIIICFCLLFNNYLTFVFEYLLCFFLVLNVCFPFRVFCVFVFLRIVLPAVHSCLSVSYFRTVYVYRGDRGSTVVKVLCYKSEGRWFDPSWCQWILH